MDAGGNSCQQTPDEGAIGMELLTGSLTAGGTVLPDLQLAGEVVSAQDTSEYRTDNW
jgi:hypothetical protein